MVETSSGILLHEFEKILSTTDFDHHFESRTKTFADRVIGQQLKMVHKRSGIQCFLLFSVKQSSAIIRNVMDSYTICKIVIIMNLTYSKIHMEFKFLEISF